MGRHARFGKLHCGGCSEKQRDELTCGLPGHEREPKKVPTYKVEMGGLRKAVQTKVCPWAVAFSDRKVVQWLTAYALIERYREWPPGRRDPRLLEAITVIANEHSRMTAEEIDRLKRPAQVT